MRPLFAIAPLALMLAAVGPLKKTGGDPSAREPGAGAPGSSTLSQQAQPREADTRHPHASIRQVRVTQSEPSVALRRP